MRLLLFTLGLFSLCCSWSSCVTEGGEVLFDVDIEADFDIAPALNTFETFYFPINRVPTNISAFVGTTQRDAIGRILPARADVTAVFTDIDWSIVQEVSVWMISTQDPDRRAEIFYQDQISLNNQNELRLFSSNSEVSDMIFEEAVNLEVRFRFRNITPGEIRSRLQMKFLAFGTE